jgi:hypothetical protein
MRAYKNYKEVKREAKKCSWGSSVSAVREGIRKYSQDAAFAQIQTDLKPPVRKALNYFGVRKSSKPLVIVAGYTGNFARAVEAARKGRVVFTDIHKPWVDRAEKGIQLTKTGKDEKAKPMKGFVMDIKRPHIDDKKVSAMISFEPVTLMENFNKTVLPNLGSPNGFIIATGSWMFDYSSPVGWAAKTSLKLFKTYGVQARMMNADKTTFVQFKIPEKRRKDYLFDRECFESMKYKGESAGSMAKRLGVSEKRVADAYRRYGSVMEDKQIERKRPYSRNDYMDYDYKTVRS